MENKIKNNRLLLGVGVLIVGALLLLDNLEVIHSPVSHYILNWKTLFVAIGAYLLLAKQKLVPGLLFLGLGVTFWLPEMFGNLFTLDQVFLPAMLLLAGLLLVFRNKLVGNKQGRQKEDHDATKNNIDISPAEQS